ncbi:hypothetical protein Q4574_12945 [Aliiglaciecola sp. 3_MG-2023]|uniref:hypothetical protein n=1 Tax=Aliiglaciecola sp. 3_MG-2023 TaxID=3062644 RepID=UPI0026E1EBCA|nr:hypothetical protein [Aliiglaciecola sp. 3_MG-2023]MDO6694193.1 hypothetical protein [Aliiglaciecola sp. 3_MG-2023]
MIIKCFLFMCLLAANSALAQNVINISDFSESLSKKVKVSGTFLKGIQYESADDEKFLSVKLISGIQGLLCISITSKDGKYKASMSHEIDGKISGFTRIVYQSKFMDELQEYDSNSLAVLASVAGSCESTDKRYFISTWTDSVAKSNVVMLIRSNARRDSVSVGDTGKSFKCEKINSPSNVSYDKKCVLENTDLTSINKLVVKRKKYIKIPDETILLAM